MYLLQVEIPKPFFDSLKDVASSPYALLGYIVLIICWVILSYRSYRLKLISQSIKSLPESDRKHMLQTDYGYYLKEGVTAGEFIRIRRNSQIFYIVLLLILAITVVIIVALLRIQQKPSSTSEINHPLCDSVNKVMNEVDKDFKSLIGKKDNDLSDSEENVYFSTLKIPHSEYNYIYTSKNDDSRLISYLYEAGDKTLAYKTYANTVSEIKTCFDDWIETPANTDESGEGILEYTSFVKDKHRIIVTFSFEKEDSAYSSTMIMEKVPKH